VKPLPSNVISHKRTREFSETSVPAGLCHAHTTKRGVWAQIHVLQGSLRYRIFEPDLEEHVLSADRPGVVEPEVPHEVEPMGPVRFYVEFFRIASEGSAP